MITKERLLDVLNVAKAIPQHIRDTNDELRMAKLYCSTAGVGRSGIDLSERLKNPKVKHECRSSFCLLGFMPILGSKEYSEFMINRMAKYITTYRAVEKSYILLSDELLGLKDTGWLWDVLFSECWPDDTDFLIERIQFVYDNYYRFVGFNNFMRMHGMNNYIIDSDSVAAVMYDMEQLLNEDTYFD